MQTRPFPMTMAALSDCHSISSLLQVNRKGWNTELVLNSNKIEEFSCKSCNQICRDAVELSCQHNDDEIDLYCNDCLLQILKENDEKCPINPMHKITSVQPIRSIRKLILKLKVVCPFSNHFRLKNMKNDETNEIYDNLDEKEGMNLMNNRNDCDWIGSLNYLITNHIKHCKLSSNDIMLKTIEVMKEKLDKNDEEIKTINDKLLKKDVEIFNLKETNQRTRIEIDEIKKILKQITNMKNEEEKLMEIKSIKMRDEMDYFALIGSEVTKTKQNLSVAARDGDSYNNCTCFGNVKIASMSDKIYKWYIRIDAGIGNKSMVIGIVQSDYNNVKKEFFRDKISINYGYSGKNGEICSSNKWKAYGEEFEINDVICMELNLRKGHFIFHKNDKYQGIAYKIERQHNISYKLAVSLGYKNSAVTLTRFTVQ